MEVRSYPPVDFAPGLFDPARTTEHYDKVHRFATLAGNQMPDKPTAPDPKKAVLCARLIMEEAMETVAALGVDLKLIAEASRYDPLTFKSLVFEPNRAPNLPEVVDGACDTRVVSTFAMAVCGVRDAVPQERVDDNNLGKFNPELGGYKCPTTGKWIKPANYPKPAIVEALRDQGWEG